MIKNLMQSKLFALFSTVFFSLLVSVLLFGTSSKAYDYGESSYEYYYGNMVPDANYRLDIYSNLKFAMSKERTPAAGSGFYYPCVYYNDQIVEVYEYYYRFYTLNPAAGGVEIPGMVYNVVSGSNSNGKMHFLPGDMPLFDTDLEMLDYFTGSDIDFDNPFYSANIVAPNMSVTYRDLSSTPVVDVPLNIMVNSYPNLENEYYIQLFGLINFDENYYVQNTRDGIVFNGMDLQKYTTYVDIVTPQELLKPSDLSYDMLHLRFTDGWYDHFPPDSLFSFTFQDGIPGPLQTSAITKFNNFRKNATFADNAVYVYARYFVIDEDNNFVVGPWRIWKSYNPNEFTSEVPNYYLPYAVVPGTTGTNSSVDPVSTSSPEPSVIDNPVQTNPTVNVTVTQNVPNYPDYPTIASYNKDNLLVDTMNQLTSIQGFFGEFGSFLVTAFAFMPAWIWAIIGVGFSLSIVVMFLKIL